MADSDEVRRMGLQVLLERSDQIEPSSTSGSIFSLLRAVRANVPQVVLLDCSLLRSQGSSLIGLLTTTLPHPPKLIITMGSEDEDIALDAVRAGAFGIVPRESSISSIVTAIQQATKGNLTLLPQRALRLLISSSSTHRSASSSQAAAASMHTLTSRESEVVRLVAHGLNNHQIALQLSVSESTVKTHLNRAMKKLHLSSRAAVVAFTYRNGPISQAN